MVRLFGYAVLFEIFLVISRPLGTLGGRGSPDPILVYGLDNLCGLIVTMCESHFQADYESGIEVGGVSCGDVRKWNFFSLSCFQPVYVDN